MEMTFFLTWDSQYLVIIASCLSGLQAPWTCDIFQPIHSCTHYLHGTAQNTEDTGDGCTEERVTIQKRCKPNWWWQNRGQGSLLGIGHWHSRKENGVKEEPGPALGTQALLRFGDLQERWGLGCRSGTEIASHIPEAAGTCLPTAASPKTTGPQGPSHIQS